LKASGIKTAVDFTKKLWVILWVICESNNVAESGKKRRKTTHALTKKPCTDSYKASIVPRTGFEPAHLAAPPPEDGASTNFATWADD
jgi:hypothetical protein